MIWKVVEKLIGYLFTLAILYICSQTILQWNATQKIDRVKDELRKEFDVENKELRKQIIVLELNQNNYAISQKNRLDLLEKDVAESKK